MENKLQKPEFSKIANLKPAVHCFFVYGKIISATKSENTTNNGRVIAVVEGTIADDSGAANFRLTGNHVANITEGKTVAFRNGKSNVVDDHIVLELDQFGRVTAEDNVPFKDVNTEINISNVSWEKAPRKNN